MVVVGIRIRYILANLRPFLSADQDALAGTANRELNEPFGCGMSDDWGDIVKCCVSERGASLLNDWLGGLLGLLFAIDELNADDDLGDEFKALQSTPKPSGLQGEFKAHRQGRDP